MNNPQPSSVQTPDGQATEQITFQTNTEAAVDSYLAKRVVGEVLALGYYVYALYSFFHYPQIGMDGAGQGVFAVRLVFLLFAIPLLYLARIAYAIGWGDALASVFSSIYKFENQNVFFQIKLFHRAIYWMLTILVVIEVIEVFFR